MNSKAQGSLSYLFLIGGAILIGLSVMLVLTNIGTQSKDSSTKLLEVYKQQLDDTIKGVQDDGGSLEDPLLGEGSFCGNLRCDSGETWYSCPEDCVKPPPEVFLCGNFLCEPGEEESCPDDCFTPPPETPDKSDGIPGACFS
ncbi:MAG: hypothetical protein ABH821_02615 [archaeon]